MFLKTCDGHLINCKNISQLSTYETFINEDERIGIEQEYILCLTAVTCDNMEIAIGFFYDWHELTADKKTISECCDIALNDLNFVRKTKGLTYGELIEKVSDRSYFK